MSVTIGAIHPTVTGTLPTGDAAALVELTSIEGSTASAAGDLAAINNATATLAGIVELDGAAHPAAGLVVGGWVYGAGGVKTTRAIEIDAGNGQVVCDSAHHEQHEGFSFKALQDFAAVGAGASVNLLLFTGNAGGQPHMTFGIEADNAGRWRLFESPTVTAAGTAVAAHNALRAAQATHVTSAVATHTPTTTADGTQIDGGFIGSSTGPQARTGATVATRSEWILAPATRYLLRFTAVNAGTNVTLKLDWYSNHNAAGGHVL